MFLDNFLREKCYQIKKNYQYLYLKIYFQYIYIVHTLNR